ncbi:MAG: methyltransferase domain-containing protein [Chloroflexi bacterium]|nr:methyltransferase domain-containing protein [Chloroflexota bacterium]
MAGLESFGLDELRPLSPRPAIYAPSPRFSYGGSWAALLRLRTVVAVHVMVADGLPRPTALLDDGIFRRLIATVGHIRSLHGAGAFKTFRLSAAGADSPVFQRFAARLTLETGLKPAEDAGDLLLRCRRGADGGFELLVRISPRPLAARSWRVCNRPGALNAAVASIVARLSVPRPTDVYLNLACGSGTLLVERASLGPAARLLGCDLDAEALACATRNVEAAGLAALSADNGATTTPTPDGRATVELAAWDATALPLADASVDALTVDLPFGQLVGTHTENAELYPRLLAEAARVARPGARLAAITQQVRLFERSVRAETWIAERVLRPTLTTSGGAIKPGIYVLRRA